MKKFIFTVLMLLATVNINATTISLESTKSKSYYYDMEKIKQVMKKYHEKYGNGEVDLSSIYYTIVYYSNKYDLDLAYSLSFFAVESGFTYECKSKYSAVGMGQNTKMALDDFNEWYGTSIPFSYMNGKRTYDYNVMVSLGYLRMCWDRYRVIQDGRDLIWAYNIGVSNLAKIKKGIVIKWEKDSNGKYYDYWKYAGQRYEKKFNECYSDFLNCRVYKKR